MNTTYLHKSALPSKSLYVQNLDEDVDEITLIEEFSKIGPLLSVRICNDVPHFGEDSDDNGRCAYVTFQNVSDALKAKDFKSHFQPILNNHLTIEMSVDSLDPNLRKSTKGNVFVKNLHEDFDNKRLFGLFEVYGDIISCQINLDDCGKSLGYGYVRFKNQDCADNAIKEMNGKILNGKTIFVGHFIPKQEREELKRIEGKSRNLFFKNIAENICENDIEELFSKYGDIKSVTVERDAEGQSKKFGFVSFNDAESAKKAMMDLNGKEDIPQVQTSKTFYVSYAQKKEERMRQLNEKFHSIKIERQQKLNKRNLYVKNLDLDIDSEYLRKIFEQFGSISSAKVMCDEDGGSLGFGFVCFSCEQEAKEALTAMSGIIVLSKPLYVAFAESREERDFKLNRNFNSEAIGDNKHLSSSKFVTNDRGRLPFDISIQNNLTPQINPQFDQKKITPFPQHHIVAVQNNNAIHRRNIGLTSLIDFVTVLQKGVFGLNHLELSKFKNDLSLFSLCSVQEQNWILSETFFRLVSDRQGLERITILLSDLDRVVLIDVLTELRQGCHRLRTRVEEEIDVIQSQQVLRVETVAAVGVNHINHNSKTEEKKEQICSASELNPSTKNVQMHLCSIVASMLQLQRAVSVMDKMEYSVFLKHVAEICSKIELAVESCAVGFFCSS